MIQQTSDIKDAPIFSHLGCDTFTQTFGHLYKPEDLALFLNKSHSEAVYRKLLVDPAHALWLASDTSGKPVGYAVCGPCSLPVPDLPKNSGELARLYLLGPAQGSGLGSALLKTSLAWLDANFDHVYLSVYAENFGAQRLYARYGFEKIHDYHYMVGNHADPEWIMQRR